MYHLMQRFDFWLHAHRAKSFIIILAIGVAGLLIFTFIPGPQAERQFGILLAKIVIVLSVLGLFLLWLREYVFPKLEHRLMEGGGE